MAKEMTTAQSTVAAKGDPTTWFFRWIALGICFFAYMVSYMPRLGLGPLATFIKDGLELTKAQVGFFGSAATAGYAIFLIPAGLFCDKFGARWTMVTGQILGGVFLVAMLFANSLTVALVVMFGMGCALGFISPSTSKGVVDWFARKERGTAFGVKQMSVNAAGLGTAMILPIVGLHYGWRVGFAICGAVAIFCGIVTALVYKDPPRSQAQPPQTPVAGSADPTAEKKESRFQILTSREVLLLFSAVGSYYIAEMGVMTYFVMYLKGQLLVSVVAAGFMLGVIDVGGVIGKPLNGFVSDFFMHGKRKWVLIEMLLGTTIIAFLFGIVPIGTPNWVLYIMAFFFGITAMSFGGVYYAMLSEVVGLEHAATAISTAGMVMMVCGMVGVPIFGYISDVTGGWTWSWIFLGTLGLLSTICVAFVREEKRRC